MINEETKILNPEMNNAAINEQPVENNAAQHQQPAQPAAQPEKKSNNGARFAASALGGALGAGTVVAADRIIAANLDKSDEQTEDKPEDVKTDPEKPAQPEEPTQPEEPAKPEQPQTAHTTEVHHHHHLHVEPQTTETATVVVEEPKPTPTALVDDTVTDDEVHVVGVAFQENGEGGVATIAGLQSGEEMAIVIDVDTDGTIDYAGFDDNKNGSIDDDEWRDVSDRGLSTEAVLEAYVEEAHEQGVTPVAVNLSNGEVYELEPQSHECGMPNPDVMPQDDPAMNGYEDMHLAMNDDMPDYMNDGDISMMEA